MHVADVADAAGIDEEESETSYDVENEPETP